MTTLDSRTTVICWLTGCIGRKLSKLYLYSLLKEWANNVITVVLDDTSHPPEQQFNFLGGFLKSPTLKCFLKGTIPFELIFFSIVASFLHVFLSETFLLLSQESVHAWRETQHRKDSQLSIHLHVTQLYCRPIWKGH